MTSGWLNRAAGLLPPRPPRARGSETALSVGATVALLLRGPAPVATWLPEGFARPGAGLYRTLAALHHADPVTGPAIVEGLRERGFTEAVLAGTAREPRRFAFPALARAAGQLLAAPDGPRIAALELGGWDTHAAQLPRLAGVLGELDTGLIALKEGLGDAWARTAIVVMTEFGRTVHANGTRGTDHGTAGAAFVLGGAVAGGRVIADWPGLGPGRLFENRDLAPSADLRALAKGLLADHLGLPAARLGTVFPDSAAAPPMRGLLKA